MLQTSFATSDDNTVTLNELLAQEKINLTTAIKEAQALLLAEEPKTVADVHLLQQQNSTMLSVLRAKIANLDDFSLNQRRQQQSLMRRLKQVQQLPIEKTLDHPISAAQVDAINTLMANNIKTMQLIETNLNFAKTYELALLAEQHRLDLLKANRLEQEQINKLEEKIVNLKEQRNALYLKNSQLQAEKQTYTASCYRDKTEPRPSGRGSESLDGCDFKLVLHNELEQLLNNQTITLLQQKIATFGFEKKRIEVNYSLLKQTDTKSIEAGLELDQLTIKQLNNMEHSIRKILDWLNKEQKLLSSNGFKSAANSLQKSAMSQLQQVDNLRQVLQADLLKKQEQFNKQLGSRQKLAEYHVDSWPVITSELMETPLQFYHYTRLLVLKVKDNYLHQTPWSKVLLWSGLGFIFLLALMLTRVLHTVVQNKERSSMSGLLYDGVQILLYRNIWHLTLAGVLVVVFFVNHVVFDNYQLLINLFFVWLTSRNLILIARITLLERISDSSGQDVKLYYRLKWLFLAGGWSTALMVFSHQLPLSLLLQDIFNRFFMLFLLAMSLVAWKSHDIIPHLLWPVLKTRKRYLRSVVSLLVVLIPLTLLTTSIIGLIGYIDLAWTMSRYQAYFLLVLTIYMVIRGLILDALDLLSQWMVSSLHNGWLWIEVFLKPLDKIMRVSLALCSLIILFQLFGWSADSKVVSVLWKIGEYPFVNLSGARITLVSVLEFIALLFIFIWVSKWTREFAYRWLYRNITDPGIRNSLSVFTQYAVIAVSGLIALRVLGIDFSGMALVFGGLAVGMGFGLRDFASNIVGGVMLLIERPVREGDVITLGEYEGRVAHIGIRSMRVSSWDNMEVLIPNAETFNKPFTNWTHQDSVVRTVVPIKVSRGDDPTVIQRLILDVLAATREVLNSPESQVLLKKIDDVLLEFEVRYFINVQHHTRFEVRSIVLFAIMLKFKEAGVKAPVPSMSIAVCHDAPTNN